MKIHEFLATLNHLATHTGYREFANKVEEIIDLLNEADYEDTFGTQGWKYMVDMDEN